MMEDSASANAGGNAAGEEESAMEVLQAKLDKSYRRRLVEFYELFNPEKVQSVPAILTKYRGKEEPVFLALRSKYDISRASKVLEKYLNADDPPSKERLTQLQDDIAAKIQEVQRLSSATADQQERIRTLQDNVKKAEAANKQLNKELSKSQSTNKKLQSKADKLSASEAAVKKAEAANKQLNKELSKSQSAVKKLQSKLDKLTARETAAMKTEVMNEHLNKELSKSQASAKKLQSKLDKLSAKVAKGNTKTTEKVRKEEEKKRQEELQKIEKTRQEELQKIQASAVEGEGKLKDEVERLKAALEKAASDATDAAAESEKEFREHLQREREARAGEAQEVQRLHDLRKKMVEENGKQQHMAFLAQQEQQKLQLALEQKTREMEVALQKSAKRSEEMQVQAEGAQQSELEEAQQHFENLSLKMQTEHEGNMAAALQKQTEMEEAVAALKGAEAATQKEMEEMAESQRVLTTKYRMLATEHHRMQKSTAMFENQRMLLDLLLMQAEDESSLALRATYLVDDAKIHASESRVFGWLWKRGKKGFGSSSAERKRWLSLRPDNCDIAYYDSKDTKQEMPKGTIDLRKVTTIKFRDAREGKAKEERWLFEVVTPERTWYLRATSMEERSLWICHLGLVTGLENYERCSAPPPAKSRARALSSGRGKRERAASSGAALTVSGVGPNQCGLVVVKPRQEFVLVMPTWSAEHSVWWKFRAAKHGTNMDASADRIEFGVSYLPYTPNDKGWQEHLTVPSRGMNPHERWLPGLDRAERNGMQIAQTRTCGIGSIILRWRNPSGVCNRLLEFQAQVMPGAKMQPSWIQ